MKPEKASGQHIEVVDDGSSEGQEPDGVKVMGTVKLTEGSIVYIPTPTADPRDPLNMSLWQKTVILIVISTFSTVGMSLVSGFGGLLGFYIPEYAAAGKGYAAISQLMTYPTLFMGIGNLIGMPLAIAIGRRVVLLGFTVLLIFGAVLCATAKSYEWHLASRMVLGLCAGQSEALVPMITQEIFFLHERSKCLMIQQAIQVMLTTIYVLFASPIAAAITPQGWYGLGAGLAALQFFFAFFFFPETKYDRDLSAYQESVSDDNNSSLGDIETNEPTKPTVMVCKEKPPLDYVHYEARTWKSDMRLWIGNPEWYKAVDVLNQTFQLVLFPNVFWALCLNGLTIGVNIAIGTTYSTIITGAPYNWPDSSASYVNCGQIVVALVALPILGAGSDKLIRWRARRNDGMHEPETRILPLIFPIIVGTFTAVLYGQGATHPEKYHWFIYVWTVAAYYFCFVGANIVAITYLLDSYPARAGPLLVIICAFRGFISFGTSYGTTAFVDNNGYDGAFGTFGALTAVLGLLGVPVYFWGKNIRQFTGRFAKSKTD
ncbi:hypothetical protein N7448_002272 [Penicillium atrosanguineum]|uniref:uncharacterized protein n=1 Tax=Penicillium atrosanguineum TaxID=1132637 RepID=UPI00238DA36D|nr:uncharacterized protein N7443_005675 [Penicillium atrosanguineum]KAJ5144880.1 hypothetical protein N7448_002272 [Penicillium atrosanguineum]KAJ5300673.1 hypothetical protein N7443_005675 [Penicillium atrosanguineum]